VRPVTLANMARDQPDFDIVDVINTVLPFEKHLPGMRYCGPGTKLDSRLNSDDTPRPGSEPVDRVDAAALRHDIQYRKFSDRHHRLQADKVMIRELLAIHHPTCRERLERMLVLPVLYIKRFLGLCILKVSSCIKG